MREALGVLEGLDALLARDLELLANACRIIGICDAELEIIALDFRILPHLKPELDFFRFSRLKIFDVDAPDFEENLLAGLVAQDTDALFHDLFAGVRDLGHEGRVEPGRDVCDRSFGRRVQEV